jgi:hypothetical protein
MLAPLCTAEIARSTAYGGLVFVYMGPPSTEPLFPMYDIIDTRHRDDVVLRGMRL